ncbi:MAG TPA: tetratricopeptide repeat protein [Rudaea sp.]|nr:tetratricopeptide repeat protein [Rudaea sp.]
MSLLAELQRRKVIRVGAAYLVVAWLLIQVGATVAPQLNMPEWVPRLITLLALLGFPVALVLAWLLDFSSGGIKIELGEFGNKRVFTAAAILAALALGWFVRGGMPGGSAGAEAALGARSTAVLPFLNMSSDKDNEYFSDGLTENLLHKLAQVSDLKVAARTSSFAFKGKQEDVRSIGKALGVATVVEGSVQRAGETLRITAQLIRTIDGSHIWSQRYDRKQTDLFAIQDEIAGAVTTALVGALVPEAKAAIAHGGTANLSAYDDYTRGLQQLAHYSFDSLPEAERLFQQALAKDSKYVDAMVSLVWTWDHMQFTGMISEFEFATRAAPWLDRIEALDPGNGALLGFRAHLASVRGDRDDARRLYERAIEAAPNDAAVGALYAQFLRGHDDAAALTQLDRVVRLDPANASLQTTRAFVLKDLHRYGEAMSAARRALELDPKQPNAYGAMAQAALGTGDNVDAIASYMTARRIDPKDHEIPTLIAEQLANLGEFDAAEAWIAEALRIAPGHVYPESRAIEVAFLRGDMQAVLERGLRLGPREAENVKGSWLFALEGACAAGTVLGRGAEVRARLEEMHAIPRELTPAAFRALDASHVPLEERVDESQYFVTCLFGTGGDDAQRKIDLLATYTEVLGPDWTKPHYRWFIDGYLRGDRERMVQGLLPTEGRKRELLDPKWTEIIAAFAGLADEPRLKAHFAGLRARIAQAKTELPQRLEEKGLALMP